MDPVRLAGLVLAAGLAVAAFAVPTRFVEEGGFTLEAWWCAALASAALAALVFRRAGGKAAALAGALALGTAGALGLTQPLWLQHLLIRRHDFGRPLVLLAAAALGVQALVLAVLAREASRGLARFLRQRMGPGRLAVAGAVFVLVAVHATPYVARGDGRAAGYLLQLAATAAIAALQVLNAVALAAALSADAVARGESRLAARLSLPGEDVGPPRPFDRALPWVLALAVFAASALISTLVLEGVPHVPDGVAYLFQAKTFAGGALAAPAPPAAEAFEVYLLDVQEGRWFAVTPPGWPLALALGVLASAPWIVNPLLGAAGVLLAHALARRLGGRGLANLLAFLMATSPWVLFVSASFLTHALSLALMLGAWLALHEALARRRIGLGILAGAAMGWLFLVRPLDGLLLGGATFLFAAIARRTARPWRALAGFAAGCVLVGGLVFPYNLALAPAGEDALRAARTPPIQRYLDRIWYPGANRLGFGADVGNPPLRWGDLDARPGHGALDVLLNTNQNAYNLNFELLGWAAGGLALALAHLLLGRRSAADRAALALVLLLVAGYGLYWFSGGPDYGARYWYPMLFPVLWLSARGFLTLAGRIEEAWPGARARGRLLALALLLAALALTVFVPWRIEGKYRHYRGFHPELVRMADAGALGRSLVFVRSEAAVDLMSAMLANDPWLPAGRPVFVRDRGAALNAAVRAAFPDRPAVVVQGRGKGPGPVRVVAGP